MTARKKSPRNKAPAKKSGRKKTPKGKPPEDPPELALLEELLEALDADRMASDPREARPTGRGFGSGKGRAAKLTPHARALFLDALSEVPNVARAARLAGVARQGFYDYKDSHKVFAALWEDALALALGRNEEEMHRRGFVGILEPIYWQGRLVGRNRVYSDTLALAMQKAHDKNYRNRTELSGPDGGPIPVDTDVRASVQEKMAKWLKSSRGRS